MMAGSLRRRTRRIPDPHRQFAHLALLLIVVLVSAGIAVAQERSSAGQPDEHRASQGPAGQLAETSREAAGEDQQSKLKQSPAVQWLGKHLGIGTRAAFWLSYFLDFAVIAVIFWMVWRSNVLGLFRARTEGIQKAIEESRR